MVHALNKVKPWLAESGSVLVVHDLVDPPRIEIHNSDRRMFAGRLLSTTKFESQYQADLAVDIVIQSGMFLSKKTMIFENYLRADSLSALLEYLDDSWESAYMRDETKCKVGELMEGLGEGSEVVLRMISRIVKLDPF